MLSAATRLRSASCSLVRDLESLASVFLIRFIFSVFSARSLRASASLRALLSAATRLRSASCSLLRPLESLAFAFFIRSRILRFSSAMRFFSSSFLRFFSSKRARRLAFISSLRALTSLPADWASARRFLRALFSAASFSAFFAFSSSIFRLASLRACSILESRALTSRPLITFFPFFFVLMGSKFICFPFCMSFAAL